MSSINGKRHLKSPIKLKIRIYCISTEKFNEQTNLMKATQRVKIGSFRHLGSFLPFISVAIIGYKLSFIAEAGDSIIFTLTYLLRAVNLLCAVGKM